MEEWPRLFISHHKAIVVVSPRAFWDFILFIDLAHLLVSFHFFFCLIYSLNGRALFGTFLLVYLICLKTFILSRICFYTVYYCMYIRQNKRYNYVNLLFCVFNESLFCDFFCYVVYFGKTFYLYYLFFTLYLFESLFSRIKLICLFIFKSNSMQKMLYST